MNHLPHVIWELVEKYGNPDFPLGKALMALSEEELDAVFDRQADAMKSMGFPNKVILAYQTVLILYVENAAITRAVLKIGDPELRGALPEVLTPDEAVCLMEREYNLEPEEAGLLREILPNMNHTDRCEQMTQTWYDLIPELSGGA